jgi:hypothetical protein
MRSLVKASWMLLPTLAMLLAAAAGAAAAAAAAAAGAVLLPPTRSRSPCVKAPAGAAASVGTFAGPKIPCWLFDSGLTKFD